VAVPLSGGSLLIRRQQIWLANTTTARNCVIDRIDGPLVPYKNSAPQTKAAAYLAGLLRLRGLDANPDVGVHYLRGEDRW
jgi:hypothetical protein